MTQQSAILLHTYILPDKVDSLEKLLNSGGNPAKANTFFPAEKIKSVHFMRWIIAPKTDKFRASLIYSGNVDGTVEDHLNDLAKILPDSIDTILEHCEGYPEEGQRTASTRLAFLRSISRKTPAFYVGAPSRTVEQIKDEKKMQTALQEFVKENKGA